MFHRNKSKVKSNKEDGMQKQEIKIKEATIEWQLAIFFPITGPCKISPSAL